MSALATNFKEMCEFSPNYDSIYQNIERGTFRHSLQRPTYHLTLSAHSGVSSGISSLEPEDGIILGEEEWCREVIGGVDNSCSLHSFTESSTPIPRIQLSNIQPTGTNIGSHSQNLSPNIYSRCSSFDKTHLKLGTPTTADASKEFLSNRDPFSNGGNLQPFELRLSFPYHEENPSMTNDNTGGHAETTTCPSTISTREHSLLSYIWDIARHVKENETVRGKQCRLTMWELLEHFDFLNDLLFICRVGIITQEPRFQENPQLQRIGMISTLYLMCIWFTSAVAYASRRYIIYHRISPSNSGIFFPFIVFSKIRHLGLSSPETLYMFERVSWTYQLIMRCFEDIPQLIVSAIFLAHFGQSLYTYFMISYSCMLMIMTSIRMGLTYPFIGTFSLILSREPPIDSPILNEAAPTTRNIALFISINFFLWCITNGLCLCYVRGMMFAVFSVLAITSGCIGLFMLLCWVYFNKQSTVGLMDIPLVGDDEEIELPLQSSMK